MISIKGVNYKVVKTDNYIIFNEELCEGVTDFDAKTITLSRKIDKKDKDKVLRHELIHAFFVESGLPSYSNDEVLVEWLARNIPLINKAVNEVKDE